MIWLLLLACTGAPEAPPAAVPPTTQGVLGDEAYRFCHHDGADAGAAQEFCDLLEGEPDDRCPGLRETCSGASEPTFELSGCNAGSGQPGSGLAPPPKRPDAPPSWKMAPLSCDTPESTIGWLTLLLKWVGAGLVALLVLVLIRIVFATVAFVRDRSPQVATPAAVEGPEPVASAEEVPDLPSEDLLAAARRALEDGRPVDAVLLARGASLRHLADQGRLKLHRSRTDREYVRALRRDPSLQEPLREVLAAVESHRWGGRPLGAGLATRVLAQAERLLRVVGAVALLLVAIGAGDRWRYGPEGDAALYEVLKTAGFDVSWRLRGLASVDDDLEVLVLDLSGVTPTVSDWEALNAWVREGHLLVVAGDAAEGIPELGTLIDLPPETKPRFATWMAGELTLPRWPGGPELGWPLDEGEPWVLAGGADDANARSLEGATVPSTPEVALVQIVYLDEGAVLAISDARLLWNGSLVARDNEAFLGAVLAVGRGLDRWTYEDPGRVQLATVAAAGSDSPIGALANARLLPVVLQLLALVLLGALWRGWPLGPLRDPPDEGRQHFADHVRAVGQRYARLGASRHALASYASLWLDRQGAAGLREAAIERGYTARDADAFVAELEQAAADPGGPSERPRDLKTMEELWKITKRP